MINPSTGWFKIVELPVSQQVVCDNPAGKRGKETRTNIIKNKKNPTLIDHQQQLAIELTGPSLVDGHVVEISNTTTEVNLNFTLRP